MRCCPRDFRWSKFYRELVRTQQVFNRKHLGLAAQCHALFRTIRLLARGQSNFFRMLWKFNSVYNPARQLADHHRPVRYEMALPEASAGPVDRRSLYVHRPADEENGSKKEKWVRAKNGKKEIVLLHSQTRVARLSLFPVFLSLPLQGVSGGRLDPRLGFSITR